MTRESRRLILTGIGAVIVIAVVVARAPHTAGGPDGIATWTLDARPTLILGADERDTTAEFGTVGSATRLADGSVLVGDRGEFALKLYSAAGAHLGSFARLGSGPGEIRYLWPMFRCGDSVYTGDIGEGHRYSVFTLRGKHVRTFHVPTPPEQSAPYRSACNDAGVFVHLGWEQRADMRGGIFRSSVPMWLSRADSGAVTLLDSVPGSERWGQVREERVVGTRPLPLGKEPVIGIGRTQVYVGSADRFEIRAFQLDGSPSVVLQRSEPPVAVTPAHVRDLIEREVADGGEARRAAIERGLGEIDLPSTLPAYTHLLVDSEDLVWVRPFPPRDSTTVRWSVFAPTGALVAEVAVPTFLEVFEIGSDYLLGRYFDPAEAVPHVRVYRLDR
jgi:hypothetical protein